MKKYDIIVVVFESEISMLEVQAISTRKLARDIGKIILINNASTEELIPIVNDRIKNEILPQYGELASIVEIHTVIEMLGKCYKDIGWQSQQLLKLMAADFIENPLTLILDAKNFFKDPCNSSNLITDNKPRRKTLHVPIKKEEYFHNSCNIMQLDQNQKLDMVENFKEIYTPFVIWSEDFKSCIKEITRLTGKPLTEAFIIDPMHCLEFYLLEAYIAKKYKLNEYFHNEFVYPIYRIHRKKYEKMSEEYKQIEANSWVRHGFFNTPQEALDQINKIQQNIKEYSEITLQ